MPLAHNWIFCYFSFQFLVVSFYFSHWSLFTSTITIAVECCVLLFKVGSLIVCVWMNTYFYSLYKWKIPNKWVVIVLLYSILVFVSTIQRKLTQSLFIRKSHWHSVYFELIEVMFLFSIFSVLSLNFVEGKKM